MRRKIVPNSLAIWGMSVGMRFAPYLFAAVGAFVSMSQAEASPVNYSFSVTGISGPLDGVTEKGTFSYDTSSIVPGGENLNTGLLTALDFTWDGIHYDQTTANTGFLSFDSAGALTSELFGNTCSPACVVAAGHEEWFLEFPGFTYSVSGAETIFFGSVTQALVVAEPSSLALLSVGLALLGTALRRKARLNLP